MQKEALELAAEELATAINESLPDPKDCDHQFSADFEKSIMQLVHNTEQNK